VAALHQTHRERGGDGGLAHAALAHDHDQPVPGGGQLVDPAGPFGGATASGCCAGAVAASDREATPPSPPASKARSAGTPTVSKARRGTSSRGSFASDLRHMHHRIASQSLDRVGHGVTFLAGMEHAVDGQPLVDRGPAHAARRRCARPPAWAADRAA
jgi:hypothetical protein